ncbi:hypothetical protein LOTGIDRAFT_229002 [Lottia gigantea]|uniref:Thioredoxin domain-containing protein n=1 Tax=Lottia gigantea TaxID=225164 RepID=V4BKH8_LOTGI|nr:hypothetical protein LOTGIDRAFT_229002 [Lottia gigantea]ESO89074.1 hypothetical protein LOTGIDRAFT_229002 [Lottia gigantea]
MSELVEILGDSVLNNQGQQVNVKDLSSEDVVLGLYYSGHWCPPCRMFTPTLIKFYDKIKSKGKKFEIVFISSDRDEESYEEYMKTMPWLSLPFGPKSEQLSEKYGVSGIPTLLLLDSKTGKVITELGRAKITTDPEGTNFPWRNDS